MRPLTIEDPNKKESWLVEQAMRPKNNAMIMLVAFLIAFSSVMAFLNGIVLGVFSTLLLTIVATIWIVMTLRLPD